MTDLDRAERLVAGARAEYEPSSADRERVRRHLGARLAAAGLAGSAVANVTAATAHGATWLGGNTLLGLGKLALGTVLVTVGTGTALMAASRALSSEATTTTVARQTVRAADAEGAGAERMPDDARGAVPRAQASSEAALAVGAPQGAATGVTGFVENTPARAAEPRRSRSAERAPLSSETAAPATVVAPEAVAPPATSAPNERALDAELALLQEAKRKLTSSDYSSALATLARLDREHPAGALLEEREALRVVIACKTSDPSRSERAAAFRARHASSVYSARIESVCGHATMTGSTSADSVINRDENGH